jgi:DNA topoisomerase-2
MASQSYKKFTHEQHVLELPDTYIGDTEQNTIHTWYYNEDDSRMQEGDLTYIPGEYKLYDEIIVNSLDQYTRLKEGKSDYKVTTIKITVDKASGEISVYNDGVGIPVKIHPEEKKYIPEMIFGDLLTSSNYNKQELKHVGGKNGYGAKLANIFSTKFCVETVDHTLKKKCIITFYDNKTRKDKPKITTYKSKPYTQITYTPDYKRFKSDGITDDMIKIMKKRAYDLTCCTDNSVVVYFNDEKLESKNFEKYIDLFLGPKKDYFRVYEKSERWEIGVAMTPNHNFEQVSFVNGISTSKGGKHVDYIVSQITKKLSALIAKKHKIDVKQNFIKDNIIVFIKCIIDNPSFDSQTKECMTTNRAKFGSTFEISDKFIDNLSKSGIVEKSMELSSLKEMKSLKKNDGRKQSRLKGIPKLEDANFAGSKQSSKCTLIITEGDSAKSTAMSGLDIVGRNYWGVFPLKGKMLNVRDIKNIKKIAENEEIKNIIKIFGLEIGKEYTSIDRLRYGKILCLTDQDEDGSHIKGLLFNLFETLWPSLFNYDGFKNSMLTPIIKVTCNKKAIPFYSIPDFKAWEQKTTKKFSAKYYKGLGTSTAKEAKEYFKELKMVEYTSDNVTDKNSMELAFGKKEGSSNKRKQWLSTYNRQETLDYTQSKIPVEDFINKDLKHFSNSDNIRSIPSIVDGFKPSQRKVLFGCIKKSIKKEIKVAQLASAVSEISAYHHGEVSLQGTIVNMAQDFVGSNNLPLLEPIGQFGTRVGGGKDSAQPRYIYTALQKHTNALFNPLDYPLFNYLNDEGKDIEPEYYVPVLPNILINGAQGIGTGWSTDIPCYNPMDIIANIEKHIKGKEMSEMTPYYRGFNGKVIKINDTSYKTKGIYTLHANKIVITELPVGVWTDKYKEFLESITIDIKNKNSKQIIKHYNTYCTDIRVHFEIFMDINLIEKLDVMDVKSNMTKLEKALRLCSIINLSNMVLFDKDSNIKKYNTTTEIIEEFCGVRGVFYQKRKDYLVKDLQSKINLMEIKIRFINEFINETIKVIRVKRANVIKQLEDKDYPKMDDKYDYLLKISIDNLTEEKIEELEKNCGNLKNELDELLGKTHLDLWTEDIGSIKKELKSYGYDLKKKKLKIVANK